MNNNYNPFDYKSGYPSGKYPQGNYPQGNCQQGTGFLKLIAAAFLIGAGIFIYNVYILDTDKVRFLESVNGLHCVKSSLAARKFPADIFFDKEGNIVYEMNGGRVLLKLTEVKKEDSAIYELSGKHYSVNINNNKVYIFKGKISDMFTGAFICTENDL